MPDHDLRTTIDALCARLQSDLQSQAAELAERHSKEREKDREEWQGRLQAGIADATAEADRRAAIEADRARAEIDALTKAATETAERHKHELDSLRADWEGRLQAGVTDANARFQGELEQALAAERQRAASEVEAERSKHQTLLSEVDAERSKHQTALSEAEADRAKHQSLLSEERDRSAATVEAERIKNQALAAALEEMRSELAAERETARQAAAQFATEREAMTAREAQGAAIEQLLGGVRAIREGRSLSETLTNLTNAAASLAPRVALFVVNGGDLQSWRAEGFDAPSTWRVTLDDRAASGLLGEAITSARAVSTTAAPAPAFAGLPADRAGFAVPITVGGHAVAVLYADDRSLTQPDTPAYWPEALQILAAHASVCLAEITAVRTMQALQQMPPTHAKASSTEEESSARRYARLLVSEIKLYNEAAVRTGREKRDLLNRLAPEIERARRLYEERVSPSVAARSVYFQQELVHTLADGDSALLGGAS